MSLQPSATVILTSVGELDRVVACTKYCADVVPEITLRPRIILADSWTANAEQIMAAQPELVIASVPYQKKAVVEILKSGARFLGFAPRTLADIFTDIAIIAGAVGASDHGDEVIARMQREIEQVRARTAGLPRSRVFCEEWGKPRSLRKPGLRNLWRLLEVSSWARRSGRFPQKRWSAWIQRSWSRPGAARATACRWRKSLTSASGRELAPLALRRFTAFVTNTSTRRSHASPRSRRAGVCDSSPTLCAERRNPPDYPGSVFHSRGSLPLS